MIDIKTIKSNNLFKVSNFTAPRDLPETGNAGFNTDATFMMGGILIVFVNSWRTSADERHAAFKDIKELWKFINTGFSEDFTNLCDTGIIFHLKHKTLHFILIFESLEFGLCILVHGAEFIDIEEFAIAADAFLLKDDGPGIFKKNERGDDESKNETDEAANEGTGDIHEAF